MPKSTLKFKTKPDVFKNAINNSTVKIKCPKCSKSIDIQAKQIGSAVICPYCKVNIKLNDNGFSSGIDKIQKSFDKIFK